MSGTARIAFPGTNPRPLAFRGALVNLTAVESTTTGIGKKIPWDASVYDTEGFWAVSPNPERLTIPIGSGITKIRLSANITWGTNSSGTRLVKLFKNGLVNVDEGQFQEQCLAADSGVTSHSPSSAVIDVIEGDYFEAEVTQTSGGALNILILSNSQPTWFQIEVVESIPATAIDHAAAEFPRWSVHKNADQLDVGTANELITWEVAIFDEGANIDLVTNYDFTVPAGAGGIYVIKTNLHFINILDEDRLTAEIFVNGSRRQRTIITCAGADNRDVFTDGIIKLDVGDVVTIRAANFNRTTSDVDQDSKLTWWQGCRIA